MAHPAAALLLAHLAVSATPARASFAFEDDSLRATLVPLGAPAVAAGSPGPADWGRACAPDSDAIGNAAWFEVQVDDLRAGTSLRFPTEGAAVRKALRQACRDGSAASPGRLAAGLRALAEGMRVRMRGQGGGK